jgi:hypothetical protein
MGQDTVSKIWAKLNDCLPDRRVKKVVAVTSANSTIFQDLEEGFQSNTEDPVELIIISPDAPAPSVGGRWLKGSTSTYQDRPLLGDVFKTAQRLGKIESNIATYTDYLKALDRDNNDIAPRPINTIRDEVLPDQIDLLVCDDGGCEVLGLVEALWGAKAVLLTQVKDAVGPNWVFEKLFNDPLYDLVYSDDTFAGGTSLFVAANVERRRLPIHFFTIVLNGEPFIRYHEEMLSKLRCEWHWHVVEGVADLGCGDVACLILVIQPCGHLRAFFLLGIAVAFPETGYELRGGLVFKIQRHSFLLPASQPACPSARLQTWHPCRKWERYW